jgi:hypothetical protein
MSYFSIVRRLEAGKGHLPGEVTDSTLALTLALILDLILNLS